MKRLIVIAAALFLSATAFAEGFGIIGGYTASSLKMKEMTFKNSGGIHAGFAINVPLGLGFNIQPELLYNVKGYNWEGDTNATELQNRLKFGYVEVPVQLQWGPDLLLLRPYVLAEPFAGFAVTGRKIIEKGETTVDWDSFKSRLEYGVGVGAGIEIYNRVQVSFKYYWNFEDATQWSDVTDKVKGKGFSGLTFTAGIFF